LAIIAALLLLFLSYRRLREEIIVDHCLSGLHGSFDYSKMACDLESNHTYSSYDTRHPYDAPIFALALGTIVTALFAYLRSRTKRKERDS
jgi:hypothetical protein